MKNPVTKKVFVFLLIAGLYSCVDNETNLDPVGSGIIVEIREILNEGSTTISLAAETRKTYSCYNYSIEVFTQTDDDNVKITFMGVPEIDFCLLALTSARTSIDLGNLSNGNYWLELNNAHLKNKGVLSVGDSEIRLNFGLLQGVEFSRSVLKRVPAQSYWGSIGYHKQGSKTLVDQFIQKLSDQGVVFNKQLPGDYWHYTIDPNGEIVDLENHGYYFIESVIFQYDGDENALKELIRSGGGINKADLSINFTSFKGEQINNWSN